MCIFYLLLLRGSIYQQDQPAHPHISNIYSPIAYVMALGSISGVAM